jgi:L-ascorbate metabolism protein UlaG (beta-lactamase superfamily)
VTLPEPSRDQGNLHVADLRLTWLGHSGVLVETGGQVVVADPLLRPRIGALRRTESMPDAAAALLRRGVDVVLLSHLHHDHCDLPTLRALRAPVLVVPPGAGAWLARQGLTGVLELAPGESLDLPGDVRVTAAPAEHLGRRAPFGPTASSVGHLVEGPAGHGPGRSAWLAGDTGLFEGMAGLAELTRSGHIDVAAVPVWGWGPNIGPGHLDPDRAAEAVLRVGVRRAVPVHWGTLHPAFLSRRMQTQLTTPGLRFAEAIARLDVAVRAEVLPLGGSTSV